MFLSVKSLIKKKKIENVINDNLSYNENDNIKML
jgi:hypothetical protein